jgi:4-diphosphocytidyl-2-C-methyl-D-erythritol kinase
VRVLAPAKLNFGLRIVDRRGDGYHELESVFVPLDLTDELEVEAEPGAETRVELRVSGLDSGVPRDADNLAARAAMAFLDAAGLRLRVRIALAKRVPPAAGLGGGSSDAAAVLRALSERYPGAVAPEALASRALELGADVPFFLDPRPALVGGIGERRAPLPGRLPSLAVLLANPGVPLPTARVFAAYAARATGHGPRGRLERTARELLAGSGDALVDRLAPLLENDLEPAAEALCPALGPLRAALRSAGARAIGLSGSGATLFGVFATPGAARDGMARVRLPARAWCRLAKTLESG